MAQTSFGWKGTVNELQWAQLAALMGHGSGLAKVGDCTVTQVTGQRSVSISAGGIFGDGVLTTLSSAETVALPAPTNGQWFLLVLNRIWNGQTTALGLRNGPTTATAAPGAVPTSYPATFATGVGSNSDTAVAWLWGNSSGTAVTIVPIIRAPASVQPRKGTTAQRNLLYGSPTAVAAQLALQGQQWTNIDNGLVEEYAAAYDVTLNAQGIYAAAGWYPLAERAIVGAVTGANGNTVDASRSYVKRRGSQVTLNLFLSRQGTPFAANMVLGTIPAGFRPLQTVSAVGVYVTGPAPGVAGIYVNPDGTVAINGYHVSSGSPTALLISLVYELS